MKKFLVVLCALIFLAGCNESNTMVPTASSGVKKTNTKLITGNDGLTIEQKNVIRRLTEDNKPGATKYLYVISAYSGQPILTSTVIGKVTSSGKRLTPRSVIGSCNNCSTYEGFLVDIGNERHRTGEVLEDDGTYGNSVEYIYWWDVNGVYHQHYISGGQIVHIASQPVSVKGVTINIENKKGN